MISVIYFGRNDNHGYNLAKRGALCLNTTASLLSSPTDEIVFVDYNTPDALPTFPEMLADTLTEEAKARLRILRVRPHQHAGYAQRSPLPVIGVLAINAGIRRSHLENRWVLISSTDMILVPHAVDASLSSICAELEPGIHQLPRYELPEFLWETLDRKDPHGARRAIQQYGSTLHLNEITPTEPPVLYDNPGDFQLVERADLFEIDGLDERMIVGWNHPDSNLARRLQLLGREDRTLAASLAGYHCAHTITINVTNHARRLENDEAVFVHNVDQPSLPAQRDGWGLANQEIEEIRLAPSRAKQAIAALEATLSPPLAEPSIGGRRHDDFNRAGYPARHVAAYVANLLTFAPPRSSIGWLGPKGLLHELISRWLKAVEDGPELVDLSDETVPTEAMRWVIVNLGLDEAEARKATEHLHWLPAEQQTPIWSAFARFVALADLERRAPVDSGRQYIVLNAIHTVFEAPITQLLDVTMTPHTMRLRAGPVRRTARPSIYDALAIAVREALEHADTPTTTEVSRALCQALVVATDATTTIDAADPATVAILRSPHFQPFVADPAVLERSLVNLEKARPSNHLAGRSALKLSHAARSESGPALCKLAAAEDWEDSAWRRCGELFGGDSYDYFRRHRATWIRAHLLYGIERLGLFDPAKSVAVITQQPDDFYLRLRTLRPAFTLLTLTQETTTQAWRSRNILASPWTEPIAAFTDRTAERFDGVVVLPDCLPRDPRDAAVARIRGFLRLVKPGGIIALAGEVSIDQRDSSAWIPVNWLRNGTLARRLNVTPLGEFDDRLSALTLDRVQLPGAPSRPHLVLDDNGDLITSGAWFARV